MRRITTLFLALLLTLSLTACGSTAQPNPPAQTGDDASQTETPDTAPEPAEEPEEPQQEPYVISSPTVDRGTVDGVTYVPWDGVVEHLFFHPIPPALRRCPSAAPSETRKPPTEKQR